MEDLVAVARVVKPRGLKGEVVADTLTDFPERFDGLEKVTAVMPDGERLDLKIEEHWFQHGRVVLKFAGRDSVESAEELRGCEICVTDAEAVELSRQFPLRPQDALDTLSHDPFISAGLAFAP